MLEPCFLLFIVTCNWNWSVDNCCIYFNLLLQSLLTNEMKICHVAETFRSIHSQNKVMLISFICSFSVLQSDHTMSLWYPIFNLDIIFLSQIHVYSYRSCKIHKTSNRTPSSPSFFFYVTAYPYSFTIYPFPDCFHFN